MADSQDAAAKRAVRHRSGGRRWGVTLLIILAAVSCRVTLAADCADPRTSEAVAQCLAESLRSADAHINETYTALMSKLDSAGQQSLRKEQRAWIRQRDSDCGLNSRSLNREQWYQGLLANYSSAVCVTRYTHSRSADLDRLLGSVGAAGGVAPPPPASTTPPPGDREAYRFLSQPGRQSGLWYFETTIGAVSGVPDTMKILPVWIGCARADGAGGGGTARLSTFPSLNYMHAGVALDLRAGKLYTRTDSGWVGGEPGSSGGVNIRLGQLYRCGVETPIPVKPLLENNTLDVNYGQRRFYFPIPDGYRPLSDGGQ